MRHVIVKTIEARLDGNADAEDKGIRWLAARYDTFKEAKHAGLSSGRRLVQFPDSTHDGQMDPEH